MSRLETPFRYDHVGSFLRPEKLKEARRKFDDGDIGYDELKKVEDEAITELVGRERIKRELPFRKRFRSKSVDMHFRMSAAEDLSWKRR